MNQSSAITARIGRWHGGQLLICWIVLSCVCAFVASLAILLRQGAATYALDKEILEGRGRVRRVDLTRRVDSSIAAMDIRPNLIAFRDSEDKAAIIAAPIPDAAQFRSWRSARDSMLVATVASLRAQTAPDSDVKSYLQNVEHLDPWLTHLLSTQTPHWPLISEESTVKQAKAALRAGAPAEAVTERLRFLRPVVREEVKKSREDSIHMEAIAKREELIRSSSTALICLAVASWLFIGLGMTWVWLGSRAPVVTTRP